MINISFDDTYESWHTKHRPNATSGNHADILEGCLVFAFGSTIWRPTSDHEIVSEKLMGHVTDPDNIGLD